MAQADLVSRFTDIDYATKRGVSQALGVSLIDSLWRQILAYRLQNSIRLSLKSIPQVPFSITQTPAIQSKFSAMRVKLGEFAEAYRSLSEVPEWKQQADKECAFVCLKAIAEAEGKKVSDLTIKAMISGIYRESDPEHTSLLSYRDLLADLSRRPEQPYGEDFLAKEYGALLGTEELISFYRIDSGASSIIPSAQVSRTYDKAPAAEGDIERFMENLASFIGNDAASPLIKAIATIYFFDYIKPFDHYNRMMGVLLAKAIVAHAGLSSAAAYLPLEAMFLESPKYDELALETQRSVDLTYILFHAFSHIAPKVEELREKFVQIKKEGLRSEASIEPRRQEPIEVEVPRKAEPLRQVEAPEPSAPQEVEVKRPSREVPFERVETLPTSDGVMAVVAPRKSLSEKEIKEAARYIRETNPAIRPSQAKFFASHCTVGRYYTIADFKKSARCAYETARTSMDNLAAEGFYKKLKIKNKFVYTPIPQSEKEK